MSWIYLDFPRCRQYHQLRPLIKRNLQLFGLNHL
nr:MAG TPA: hypothetical protein [Bacteriophage sp.]